MTELPQTSVFTKYDIEHPPDYSVSSTRFVCISDTHSKSFPVPSGDVLLHSGDLSSWGSFRQLKRTIDWLLTLPHEYKIIIAGNHDFCLDESMSRSMFSTKEIASARALLNSEEAINAGLHYLTDEALEIKTSNGALWKCYGSPASPAYGSGAFQYLSDKEAQGIWAKIPADTEILLTHGPPLNVLDLTRRRVRAGCKFLAQRMDTLTECRLHVFGHIHESYGIERTPRSGNSSELVSVNAALMEGGQAIIVDLAPTTIWKPSP